MLNQKKASIGFIFLTIVLDVTGMGIIIPVMPDLIKELVHGNISDASQWGGWLITAYAVTQFICAPIVGSLSDKYGRRPILLLSLLGFALDFVILAVAPNIFWLFIGRIMAGVMGASITTATAYISDISTAANRAKNFGMVGAAFGIGFVVGPLIGGLLGDWGVRLPFWAAGVLAFMNALYGYFILPESLSKENRSNFNWKKANPISSIKNIVSYKMVGGLIIGYFLLHFGSHAVHSMWSYYAIEKFEWNKTMIGISLGAVGILVGLVQGVLTKRFISVLGEYKSLITGLILTLIGLVLFAFASQSWMMFLFLIPYCMGGIAGPAFQSIVTQKVPPNQQGKLQGALTSTVSLANIFGPLAMTNIFYYFTNVGVTYYFPGSSFILGAILILMSVIVVNYNIKKHK